MNTRTTLLYAVFALLMLFALAACGQAAALSDTGSLITALEGAGVTVEDAGPIAQVFLGPEGRILRAGGQDLQVFEYPDEAAAEHEAETIAPDGSFAATTMIAWVDTPHFYQAGRLIVLYVGSDAATLELLEGLLGPQFAGG